MVWEPFALALVFGLLVSAALYFIFLWPAREPHETPSQEAHPAKAPPAQAHHPHAAMDRARHSTDQSLAHKP